MKRNKLSGLVVSICISLTAMAHAQYNGPVAVETSSFGEDPFAIGSLTASTGALSSDLWLGSEAETVGFLLDHVPTDFENVAELDLLRRVLLSPGEGPANADLALTAQKLMVLSQAGFSQEAGGLAEISGRLSTRPELAKIVSYAELLRGDVSLACQRGANLQAGRNDAFWLKLRLICYAASGETAAADLTLGLLQEKEELTASEAVLFTALATGATPKKTPAIKTGFEYAAFRQADLSYDAIDLATLDNAAMRALVTDAKAPAELRIKSAQKALFLGLMNRTDIIDLYNELQFELVDIGNVKGRLSQEEDNVVLDAVAYQAVQQMNAAEFAIDRALLVGEALQAANTYERLYAVSVIYAPLVDQFETILNYAPYAATYALTGIVADNTSLAERWINALALDQASPDGVQKAVELLQLWSIKNKDEAQLVGQYLQFEITQPAIDQGQFDIIGTNDQQWLLSKLVEFGFQHEGRSSKGQSALMALVASSIKASEELQPIQKIIIERSLENANLTDIFVKPAFIERTERFLNKYSGGPNTASRVSTGEGGFVVPRLKPATP